AAIRTAFATLRRGVLGGRKITAAALAEIATTTPASTAAETAAPAPELRTLSAPAAVTAAIIAAVTAGSKVRRWAVLRGIVLRSEILRRRFVRIGLALVFGRFVHARGAGFGFFNVGAYVVSFG